MIIAFTNKINQENFSKELDSVDDFDFVYSCTKEIDEANKQSGTGSIKLTKTSDAVGYFVADITQDIDLSGNTSIKYNFYVADRTNIDTIGLVLFTTAEKSYDNCWINYVGWQIVNGWNEFTIALEESEAGFTKSGSGGLDSIKAIRFIVSLVSDNSTEVVNFDKIEAV